MIPRSLAEFVAYYPRVVFELKPPRLAVSPEKDKTDAFVRSVGEVKEDTLVQPFLRSSLRLSAARF